MFEGEEQEPLLAPDEVLPGGVFTITATFANTSENSFFDLFFEVVILEGPGCRCVVLNRDEGSGGVGSVVKVGKVSSGEAFDTVFEIGLTERARFTFFVDAFGIPGP